MALTYQELSSYVTNWVVPKITDVIFKNDPLFVRLMARNRIKFPGGLQIQRPLIYNTLAGGAFARGDQFDTGYRQTDTALAVNVKFNYVNITLFGVDDVLNAGPASAFSIVESKFANAALTMGQILGTQIYQDGQGVLSSTKALDGLIAWVDDGNSNGSYTGANNITRSFASVGGITRSDILTPPSTGSETTYAEVGGLNAYTNRAVSSFTLNDLNRAYGFGWYGSDQPDLLVNTQGAYNRIWNSTQPNQRYMRQDSDMAKVGIQSFQFNAADVVISKYMQDVVGNTYGMILGLNTNYLELYVSANPKFQFGFTGFKEMPNTIDVSGQNLFAGNLIYSNPRSGFKMIGTGLVN